MSRALLLIACASIFAVSSAKAETQRQGSSHGLSGFEFGARLSNRIDVKVPQSDQPSSDAADKSPASEEEPTNKAPIRKVRVIY